MEVVSTKRVKVAPVGGVICDQDHEPGLTLPMPVRSTLKGSCNILTRIATALAHTIALIEATEKLSIFICVRCIEEASIRMKYLHKLLRVTLVTKAKYRAMQSDFDPRVCRVVEDLTRDRVL